jgi:non-LEE-encoded effector NleA
LIIQPSATPSLFPSFTPPATPPATKQHTDTAVIIISPDAEIDQQITIDIPPDIDAVDAIHTQPSLQSLWAAIRSKGFMQAMTDRVAPHMEPGSLGRRAVDQTGLFNVTQLAVEIPALSYLGVSLKYGVQMNIVKPDIYPHDSNYYLQLFPIHDEIGFNLPQFLHAWLPKDFLPAWCGLSAQVVCNQGFEIPIIRTETGWTLGGIKKGAKYMAEWVIRPAELDLKILGTPVQATVALEVGWQVKWAMENPLWAQACMQNLAGNILGCGVGFGFASSSLIPASVIGLGDALVWPQIGAMLGQFAVHGVQCLNPALRPDEILSWAGTTFGAADVNQVLPPGDYGRGTNYLRGWHHFHDGYLQPNELRRQAEAAIAPIIDRARRNQAIEMAEMGIDNSACERTGNAQYTPRSGRTAVFYI